MRVDSKRNRHVSLMWLLGLALNQWPADGFKETKPISFSLYFIKNFTHFGWLQFSGLDQWSVRSGLDWTWLTCCITAHSALQLQFHTAGTPFDNILLYKSGTENRWMASAQRGDMAAAVKEFQHVSTTIMWHGQKSSWLNVQDPLDSPPSFCFQSDSQTSAARKIWAVPLASLCVLDPKRTVLLSLSLSLSLPPSSYLVKFSARLQPDSNLAILGFSAEYQGKKDSAGLSWGVIGIGHSIESIVCFLALCKSFLPKCLFSRCHWLSVAWNQANALKRLALIAVHIGSLE